MDIYQSQYTHKAHNVGAPHFRGTALKSLPETNPLQRLALRDEVNLSAEAIKKLGETGAASESAPSAAPRLDLINRVRAEISAGTYETPEKMNAALEKILNTIS